MTEYAYYELNTEWPEFVLAIDGMERRLRLSGRPVAADIVARAFVTFKEELQQLAVAVATEGTQILREFEAKTRVRPDTMGGGGPRLEDFLKAEPMPQIAPGTVGVVNKPILDQNVPWWDIIEEGGRPGRQGDIFGVFYNPGGSGDMPPDADAGARQEHALFSPVGSAGGGGPGQVVKHVAPQWFMRDSAPIVTAEWERGFRAISATFDAKFTRALMTMR